MHDLIERHRRSHRSFDPLDRNPEILERLFDLGLVLVNLLVAHLRIGRIILEQRHGRTLVVVQILQRVVETALDAFLVHDLGLACFNGHHDASAEFPAPP